MNDPAVEPVETTDIPKGFYLVVVHECGHEGWIELTPEMIPILFPEPIPCEMCSEEVDA